MQVLAATTRLRSADAAHMFGGERGGETSYAAVTVSIPPDSARKIGEVQWPEGCPAIRRAIS